MVKSQAKRNRQLQQTALCLRSGRGSESTGIGGHAEGTESAVQGLYLGKPGIHSKNQNFTII